MQNNKFVFNPFTIKRLTELEIQDAVNQLLMNSNPNADTPYEIANEIETRADILALIGEMIARLTYSLSIAKMENDIKENKQVYRLRKDWKDISNEKAPAMSFFEAQASDVVKEERKEEFKLKEDLTRFKHAYVSMEAKMNALKYKLQATKYETFGGA